MYFKASTLHPYNEDVLKQGLSPEVEAPDANLRQHHPKSSKPFLISTGAKLPASIATPLTSTLTLLDA
jgi:hypothetical protein